MVTSRYTISRRRRWLFRAVTLMLALLVAFLAGEIVLRALGISYPNPYIPDPHCGTRLKPGFTGRFSKEGGCRFTINRHGLRGPECSRRKPPGTFRVAVLGDSFAEALQVPEQHAFWSVMQRRLSTCEALQGKRVEVLNFGVSGYGTAEELQMLRHYVADFAPDLVVLAFYSGNDVINNSSELAANHARPFFHLQGESLRLDTSFLQHPLYVQANTRWEQGKVWLTNRCRVLQVLREARNRAAHGPRQFDFATDTVTRERAEYGCFFAPQDPRWIRAWRITERLLEQVHQDTTQMGAAFWLVTLSHPLQVHCDRTLRNQVQESLAVSDLFYAERRLHELGERSGFPVINLAYGMQQHADQHQVYLHGFDNTRLGAGHWNQAGHQLAGEQIADRICGSF